MLLKQKIIKVQVGKRGRERSDTRGRNLNAQEHTQLNGRTAMHSKPSRTPGNVSHTVLYDALFLPNETACADLNSAGEARAIWKKPPLSQVLETTLMRTREHPADIDRQTTLS